MYERLIQDAAIVELVDGQLVSLDTLSSMTDAPRLCKASPFPLLIFRHFPSQLKLPRKGFAPIYITSFLSYQSSSNKSHPFLQTAGHILI